MFELKKEIEKILIKDENYVENFQLEDIEESFVRGRIDALTDVLELFRKILHI